MFMLLTAFFALVLAAVALVALALLTSRVSRFIGDLDYRMDGVEETMKRTSTTAIKAEVDALAGALDAFRASNRKELGSLWARLAPPAQTKVVYNGAEETEDARFKALLDLQGRPASGPV